MNTSTVERAIGFEVCSSLCLDLLCAMHVVVDSSHHGFLADWAGSVLRECEIEPNHLACIREMPRSGLELCNMAFSAGDPNDADGFLEMLRFMSDAEFAYWLLGQRIPLNVLKECVGRGKKIENLCAPLRNGYFDSAWVKRVMLSAARYREATSCVLYQVRSEVMRLLEASHVRRLYGEIAKRIGSDASNAGNHLAPLVTDLVGEPLTAAPPRDHFVFVVSYFASPHRLRWPDLHRDFVVPDWQEVMSGSESGRAKELGHLFSALADTNRLIIMRELARSHSSARLLAPLLGLTAATTSHHLEVLVTAGLVMREESGSAQLYRTDLGAVDSAVREIQDYLKYRPRHEA